MITIRYTRLTALLRLLSGQPIPHGPEHPYATFSFTISRAGNGILGFLHRRSGQLPPLRGICPSLKLIPCLADGITPNIECGAHQWDVLHSHVRPTTIESAHGSRISTDISHVISTGLRLCPALLTCPRIVPSLPYIPSPQTQCEPRYSVHFLRFHPRVALLPNTQSCRCHSTHWVSCQEPRPERLYEKSKV